MESHIERESGALGGLFQTIIQDMKNGVPLWEDLIAKAAKLHSSLKATILAVTAYLEAFQKIADSATNTRGATREIGTALTRICLRHKAVEARMKTFTNTIMEFLIVPLQDKLEDWKKIVLNLDKEHAKDYKRARTELKKRSTDTLRLQKKIRKSVAGDLQKRLECGLQDVNERRQKLEETEKNAVRAALLEERGRFCTFVGFLKPVVDEEIVMLTEISHLQEAVQQLEKHSADPQLLPPASERVIADLKSSDSGWSFQTPPSSPSSLGSRKSSMCSISSLNSSSSSSSKSHQHSPGHHHHHHHWQRSGSQPVVARSGTVRYMSVSRPDSGFTSQDTLYPRPSSSLSVVNQVTNLSEQSSNSSSSSTPCTPFPPTTIIPPTTTSTWPNLQESIQFERAASAIINDRPHTISSAYEKGHHNRAPLTVYTFQPPNDQQSVSQPVSPAASLSCAVSELSLIKTMPPPPPPSSPSAKSGAATTTNKPPLPTRCSSLERPSVVGVAKTMTAAGGVRVLPPTELHGVMMKPSPLPGHLSKVLSQPTYVNMHELASMAATKAQEIMAMPPPPPPSLSLSSVVVDSLGGSSSLIAGTTTMAINEKGANNEGEKDGSTSESSLESSSGYGSQTTFTVEDAAHAEDVNDMAMKYCTLPRNNDHLNAARRRPLSMTALYSSGTTIRNTLLRRGSMQTTTKPPPPIRRTSSITNTASAGQLSSLMGSLENLPPPPAFLLEPNNVQQQKQQHHGVNNKVADTVKALNELKHTPASPNSIRRMSASSQSIFHHQSTTQQQQQQQSITLLSTFQSNQTTTTSSNKCGGGGVVYAQPSQILIGGGVSPQSIRRTFVGGNNCMRSQSAERTKSCGGGPGGVASNFIASLSAKLTPQSPRSSRRHSDDLIAATTTSNNNNVMMMSAAAAKVINHNDVKGTGKGPGQSFLDSLNAKLAQQQQQQQQPQQQQQQQQYVKANKIREIINSKAQPDPKVCHDSLMDQIKKGATLKRAKVINDRSAPKIY